MELTIEQALQQGVRAHKEGKLQDAERLYHAILQAQPKHPDANHNLGVLTIAVGKPLDAIPLFKLALEANPQIEQYWLSFIDALIKVGRFDDAKRVLVEGERSGLSSEKLNPLNQRLQESVSSDASKTDKGPTQSGKRKKLAEKKKSKQRKAQGSSSSAAPSQDQLNHLLEHYQAGRLEEAEALATSLTQQFPKHPFGWKILGATFKQMGRVSESLAPKQKAAELWPGDAEAHCNLGVTLRQLRRLDEAEASYRQAIALRPDYAEAYTYLGNTLKELGRLDESIGCFKQAIELKPDFAQAKMNLDSAFSSAVPNWHFPMMNDEVRNKAYSDALKLAVCDGDFVLDIGTGSGLLSLMAATSGAEMVITCETSKTIAAAAMKIIESNGYKEKVSVVNKKSTDLVVGVDVPQQADLIVSEVLSSEFVGEGVRATLLDSNKRLLKKGGKTIPQSGKIKIALIDNSPEIFNSTAVASVHGYDLSIFNSISQKKVNFKFQDRPVLLSSPEDAFSINLYDTEELVGQEKIIELRVNQDGLCVGLVQWISIHLYGDIEYENKPGECDSHWNTPIYLFDEPVVAKKGDMFEIKAVLGEDYVWFCQLA